jgi:hypothetical protein
MAKAIRYAAQAGILMLIMGLIGYFSDSPSYQRFATDEAQIMLSLNHGGKPKGKCRVLSDKEIARTAKNMRRPTVCPRERLPVTVEILVDGKRLFLETAAPGGLAGDSPSRIYRRFSVPTGRHSLTMRLRDSARAEGFDYEKSADVDLAPRQRLVIDFRAASGGFVVQ